MFFEDGGGRDGSPFSGINGTRGKNNPSLVKFLQKKEESSDYYLKETHQEDRKRFR